MIVIVIHGFDLNFFSLSLSSIFTAYNSSSGKRRSCMLFALSLSCTGSHIVRLRGQDWNNLPKPSAWAVQISSILLPDTTGKGIRYAVDRVVRTVNMWNSRLFTYSIKTLQYSPCFWTLPWFVDCCMRIQYRQPQFKYDKVAVYLKTVPKRVCLALLEVHTKKLVIYCMSPNISGFTSTIESFD